MMARTDSKTVVGRSKMCLQMNDRNEMWGSLDLEKDVSRVATTE